MLSMYLDIDHHSCVSIIPYITFEYNAAAQETTLLSPFRLGYGRDMLPALNTMRLPDDYTIETAFADEFAQRAEITRHLARHRILGQQAKGAGCTKHDTDKFHTSQVIWPGCGPLFA